MECRACVNLRFGPDSAAVATHDPLDGRQPHSGAFELGGRMKSLKDAKELAREGGEDPPAVGAAEQR